LSADGDNYTGSNYKGNYVWGGAMNLAWNELSANIIHGKIKLNTDSPKALATTNKLNQPVFSNKDLDEASYYAKSGYGQKTVDLINKESRKKFPKKFFPDLNIKLGPKDIISYAYFLKDVVYLTPFTIKDVNFSNQQVKGFSANNQQQRDNIKILSYDNYNKFIISLRLKDNSDELILAKGYDDSTPNYMVSEIDKLLSLNKMEDLQAEDVFEMPILHLDYSRQYDEMLNKALANKGFESYSISQMFENIKFDMDEKGATVENEAVIGLAMSMPVNEKSLIFDKPFWVIMKRTNSQNPYFILQVKNSELMKLVKTSQSNISNSNDQKRIADIINIQTALEQYFNNCVKYPDSLTTTAGCPGSTNTLGTYLSVIPTNPKPVSDICKQYPDYTYVVKNNGGSYELSYCLDNDYNGFYPGPNKGLNKATPSGYSEK
jgi:hypothetical protein